MDSKALLSSPLQMTPFLHAGYMVSAAFVCLLLVSAIRYWKDPLHPIPGPAVAKFTRVWLLMLELSGKRALAVHELHQKYGPVVRIGPNEISFSSPEALRQIYGANSKFAKAPVYDSMGFKSTFTTRNRDEYRAMKKRILPNFGPSAIAALEPNVHKHVAGMIKVFDKKADKPIDIFPWVRLVALCVVGESFAAESFGGLERDEPPEVLHEIDAVFPALFVRWMFPTIAAFLQYSPVKSVRDFHGAAHAFRKYCSTAYTAYLASSDSDTRNHDHLISRMVNERLRLSEKRQQLPRHVTDDGIVDELTNLIFAGTDTTGSSLTYLFWELAHHPEWQVRLREELKEAVQQQESYSYSAISELPVLEGVVQEIFRVRPASIGALPRVVPAGGSVVDGIFVPASTIISCQGLTTQRDPTIFPNPDVFNPQRWLDASATDAANQLEQMRSQMMLFGKGARACLGRTLATMEIKCAVAAVVQRFQIGIGSPTTDQDMEMTDHFVLIAKGQRCVLKLDRV
ncbi:uncharacterized protein HMPREF1541_01546 [Cyphellophora europaea CBS 101466]|uniref:Cytochrome P450 n=1 Tax=Cyphellophora europaea (strain CBS 101466) TaxID=1220924 RepID=W2S163_CYPE1|nr:uncharacterized protein HMPREF1541_01546 [Cyphellophora europaea CBS 101466]ETN42392.1 hypothetical protein HMPREF1541_01546 [Cyphellophora europaea CBS 101466]